MYSCLLWQAEYSIRSMEEQSPTNKMFRKIRRLTELRQTRQSTSNEPDNIRERSERPDEELQDLHNQWFTHHMCVIYIAFHILLLMSIALRFCEMAVGPSTLSKCVDLALMLWLCDMAVMTRRVFHPRLLILVILAVKSSVLSGSLTSFFNDWFWADTLYNPLVNYFQDDISDQREIRMLLTGMLLSGFFHVTSASMAVCDSIPKILIVVLGALVGIHIGIASLFLQGPWLWIWYRPGEEPGKVLKRRVIQFLQQGVLYTARLFIFSLNRLGKWLARHSQQSTDVFHVAPTQPDLHYEYEPLGPNQIRLLRVFAGSSSQPIECQLEIVNLDEEPLFEAMSYVWGGGGFDRFVIIEGKRLDVMESAYSVIERRRSRWHKRLLWIDQLCINQHDLAERASQVRLMGELYKSASRVVAWLGPSTSAHIVQSFLAELHYKKEGLGYHGERLNDSCAHVLGRHWHALSEFLQNDWFTRVWIVQEAALSKELHLLYGDVCVDWDSVGKGLAVLWQGQMLTRIVASPGSLFSDERKKAFSGLSNADTILEFRGDVDYGRVFDLSTALQNCVGFQCSNKRDKIYALGNLVEDATVIPDYGIEVPTLYIRTMKDILLRDNSLDAMAFAGIGHRPRAVEDLPTWVSDWDGDTQVPRHHTSYSAGSAHDPVISFDEADPSVAYLAGWERDRVAHFTSINEIGANTNEAETNNIQWAWYVEAEDMAMQHAMRYREETLLESFVRTPTCATSFNNSFNLLKQKMSLFTMMPSERSSTSSSSKI